MKHKVFVAVEIDEKSIIGEMAHAEKLAEELMWTLRKINKTISAEESQSEETDSPQ